MQQDQKNQPVAVNIEIKEASAIESKEQLSKTSLFIARTDAEFLKLTQQEIFDLDSKEFFAFFAEYLTHPEDKQKEQKIARFKQILAIYYLNHYFNLGLNYADYNHLDREFKEQMEAYVYQCFLNITRTLYGLKYYCGEITPTHPLTPPDLWQGGGIFQENFFGQQLQALNQTDANFLALSQVLPKGQTKARQNFANYWQKNKWAHLVIVPFIFTIPYAIYTGIAMFFSWLGDRKKLNIYQQVHNQLKEKTATLEQKPEPRTFDHLNVFAQPIVTQKLAWIDQFNFLFNHLYGKPQNLLTVKNCYQSLLAANASSLLSGINQRTVADIKELSRKLAMSDPYSPDLNQLENDLVRKLSYLYTIGYLTPSQMAFQVCQSTRSDRVRNAITQLIAPHALDSKLTDRGDLITALALLATGAHTDIINKLKSVIQNAKLVDEKQWPALAQGTINTLSQKIETADAKQQPKILAPHYPAGAVYSGLALMRDILAEPSKRGMSVPTMTKQQYDQGIGKINSQLEQFCVYAQEHKKLQDSVSMSLQTQIFMIQGNGAYPLYQLAAFCFYTINVDERIKIPCSPEERKTPIEILKIMVGQKGNKFAEQLIDAMTLIGRKGSGVPLAASQELLISEFVQQLDDFCKPLIESKELPATGRQGHEILQLREFVTKCLAKTPALSLEHGSPTVEKESAADDGDQKQDLMGLNRGSASLISELGRRPSASIGSGVPSGASLRLMPGDSPLVSRQRSGSDSSTTSNSPSQSSLVAKKSRQVVFLEDPLIDHALNYLRETKILTYEGTPLQNKTEFDELIKWYQAEFIVPLPQVPASPTKKSPAINMGVSGEITTRANVRSLFKRMNEIKKPFGLFYKQALFTSIGSPHTSKEPSQGHLLTVACLIHIIVVNQLLRSDPELAKKMHLIEEVCKIALHTINDPSIKRDLFAKIIKQKLNIAGSADFFGCNLDKDNTFTKIASQMPNNWGQFLFNGGVSGQEDLITQFEKAQKPQVVKSASSAAPAVS